MAKKRTSLDSLFTSSTDKGIKKSRSQASPIEKSKTNNAKTKQQKPTVKKEIVKQLVYLPAPVHEQMRVLVFEERVKMHDLLMEGLDLVFKKRGLKSFDDLLK